MAERVTDNSIEPKAASEQVLYSGYFYSCSGEKIRFRIV